MQITNITLHRFKKYRDKTIQINPGLSLVAGANNSGKTTVLQAFAVWEFCKTVLEMEKGPESIRVGYRGQGLGMGSDEFLVLNISSLKHLWTNLNPQRNGEQDGYTLWIKVDWKLEGQEKHLTIALSLANDRIFIKTKSTNIAQHEKTPNIIYIPPFAGITIKEQKSSTAQQRRLIGQGLPGATIRSILLNIYNKNQEKRSRLKDNNRRISRAQLQQLRNTDPWELLSTIIKEVFKTEITISPYNDTYHTYIKLTTHKGDFNAAGKFLRYPNYSARDLTAEGSGFLQWLSVFTFALSPEIDMVLLDEPDAHLHPTLQHEIIKQLEKVSQTTGKQIFFSTHSPELIKAHPAERILSITNNSTRYLQDDQGKISSLSGIGSEYHPLLDNTKRIRKILFVENESDANTIFKIAEKLGFNLKPKLVIWPWVSRGSERKHLFNQLATEIPNLLGISLNDRDNEGLATIRNHDLNDNVYGEPTAESRLFFKKWRRRYIEGYLLHPDAIARAANRTANEIIEHISNNFALNIGGRIIIQLDEPEALLDCRAKTIISEHPNSIQTTFGVGKYAIANELQANEIHEDFRILVREIIEKLQIDI
ncbi:AAA family ATPase [Ectopseudomonas chengduensis]|nr:AAA family ATPase [Pseudomonas chengduensis]WKC37547.1 AAA family ATPase [Pseudomonas chengduensis]